MGEKLEHYLGSIKEHVIGYGKLLDELREQLEEKKNLSAVEFGACERFLQVLIESGIGFAKQSLKYMNKPLKSDSYSNFEELCNLQFITPDELSLWKSAIGLRNALVHDYLEIDKEVIMQILKQKKYQQLIEFILKTSNQITLSQDV